MAHKSKGARKKSSSEPAARNTFYLYAVLFLIAVIAVYALFFSESPSGDAVQMNSEGVLVFKEHHLPEYTANLVEDNATYTLQEIRFKSGDGTVISALLRLPKAEGRVPGAVVLPGATVSKEGAQYLAGHLAEMGYASLALDQRNLGVINFEYDYQLFASGRMPVEYLMVSDALFAVDVLSLQPEVDPERIILVGESNGGRIAMIAGALHPKISMVIGISTSGYNTEELPVNMPEDARRFYRSIDPDTYLSLLPPKKLVMLHADKDPVIPIEMAERTYLKAGEPKAFHVVSAKTHGYNEQMREILERELKVLG
jgi:hypothetical protein